MAISMRLNTRGRTAVATASGLPRYARNDKAGTPDAGPPGDQRLKGRENPVRGSQAGGSQRRQVLLWRVDVPE